MYLFKEQLIFKWLLTCHVVGWELVGDRVPAVDPA